MLLRIVRTYSEFKWKMLVNLFLIFLTYSLFMVVPFFIGRITTLFANKASLDELAVWPILLGSCYIVGVIIDRVRWNWEVKHLDCLLADSIVEKSLSHMKKLSIGQHRNKHSLVTMTKLSDGENALRSFFSSLFYQILPMSMGILIALGSMCVLYPQTGLVALLFAILIVTHGVIIGRRFTKPMKNFMAFRKRVVNKSGKALIQHMGSLQIAGEHHRFCQKHLRHRVYRRRQHSTLFKSLGNYFIPCTGMSAIGRAVTLVICAYMIHLGKYEIGALAAVLAWSNHSLGQLQSTQYLFRGLSEQWADISQYFQIIDTPTDVPELDNAVHVDQIKGKVVFENVYFTYPGSDEHSLHGISLDIEPGQKVGIVGPSGAGKSTLVSLLQLAYHPQIGSIRVDGIDLMNIEHSSYRECTGFIEQTPLILSETIRENLLFGVPKSTRLNVTDKELKNVLKSVGLGSLIPRLRKKIGEDGNKISGGQKQRLAIARILLKVPDILIVDEATSAVDPTTEKLVHNALDTVSPGATRIFIAHRLSTVQDADVIVVMDKGRIIAKGKHDDLLSKCSLYEDLVTDLLLRA